MSYCRVEGCVTSVVPGRVFCQGHWFQLPAAQRQEISRLLRNPKTRGGPTLLRALARAKQAIGRAAA